MKAVILQFDEREDLVEVVEEVAERDDPRVTGEVP